MRVDEVNPTGKVLESTRTGLGHETLERAVKENLFYLLGKAPRLATSHDLYMALAYTVRERLLHHLVNTVSSFIDKEVKVVSYFSAEYLPGPHLGNNLVNLGIYEEVKQAVAEFDGSLMDLLDQEEEPGLGNGGLGRLAACYLDSLSTLCIPAIGYGMRYEFGIFDQEIRDGWQVEVTDKWLRIRQPLGNAPPRSQAYEVKLGGHTETYTDDQGAYRVRWVPERVVKGVAYDTPILGYGVNNCNVMRLWKAEAVESFDFEAFNVGDYYGAVNEKMVSENITKVLYPNDEAPGGKKLRLVQQYFFVLLLAAGHDPHAPGAAQRSRGVSRGLGRAAERHPPGDRGGRTDAAPGGRASDGLGRGLGHHAARPWPTPTTPCCRRPWRNGRCRCSPSCCPGTWRSSTKSTAASWTRCAERLPRRRGPHRAPVPHR